MSMTEITAMSRIMERLSALRFQITPEEHQLLGITSEDVQSFSDPSLKLTPQQMERAIQDIVTTAYHEVPEFMAIVTEDQRRDPNRFDNSARLVSKFLKHLRTSLPPEQASWIQPETFVQAHDIVEKALKSEVPSQAPVPQKPYPAMEPLKDEDLQLFGLKRAQITPAIRWEDIRPAIQFFLGRLKNEQGRTVKNEATKKMPDELKEAYLFRLLREIRDLKIQSNKVLRPHEQRWLGRDLPQLEQIARAEVRRPLPKEPVSRSNTPEEVIPQASELLTTVNRLLEVMRDRSLKDSLVQIGDMIDTALPSSSLVEDKLKAIQAAADELGLNKGQLSMLLGIDFSTMSHAPDISKEMIERIRSRLSETEKALARDDQNKTTPGITPDKLLAPERREELEADRKELSASLKVMEDLASRDTSRLFAAITDYTDTLSKFQSLVNRNLSKTSIDTIPKLEDLIGLTEQVDKQFNKLMVEDDFRRRWAGRGGRMFGKTDVSVGGIPKMASPDIETYTKKLEKFKGGGVRKLLNELVTFADDTEEGLEFLRDKLLSIIEASPGSERTWDADRGEWVRDTSGNIINPTQKDFSGNPMGGVGIGIEEMKKKLGRVRDIVKHLDLSRKKEEAVDILRYLADLRKHIKASAPKKNKKASVIDFLRRVSARILQGADSSTSHHSFVFGSSSNRGKYKTSGKSGWLIYRERLTKMGKKALDSFFKDTPFVADFVERMESKGLNDMLLRGAEAKAMNIDPVIEEIMQEASGTSGTFDNMLGTVVAQQVRAEEDIRKKIKDMDEASARVQFYNQKIAELNRRYLPILNEYARFLRNPLGSVREQLEQKRTPKKAPEIKRPRLEPAPIEVNKSNYQLALKSMLGRYHRGISDKMAAVALSLPTDEFRRIHGVNEQLAKIRDAIKAERTPLEKARQVKMYLETSLDSFKKAREYLDEVGPSLSADRFTIENLDKYLASEEAKKDPDIEAARAQLKTLKNNFEHEWHIYRYLMDVVKRAEDKIAREKPEEYLRKLTRDLSDDKVEQLYSVAVAPEMEPTKEEAREIRERAKAHEEGLSYIIDRDTYKKNMNKILTYRKERRPVTDYKGERKTVILPSERLEEYKKKVEEAQRQKDEIFRTTDQQQRLMLEQSLYKRLLDDYEKVKTKSAQVFKEYDNLKSIRDNLKHLEANAESYPKDVIKQARAVLSTALSELGVSEKDIDKVLQKEEKAVQDYKQVLKNYEDNVEEYRRDLKRVEDQLAQMRAPGPMTPQKLRERLTDLKVERMSIMSRADLTLDQRTKRRQEIEKEIQDIENQLNLVGQKTAAIEDTSEPRTEFEIAEELKAFKAKQVPYMKELPKPKGWEVVENFFDKSREDLDLYRYLEQKGKTEGWSDEASQRMLKRIQERIEDLEHVIPVIDAYRKQIIQVGSEAVPFRDLVTRFEDMMFRYQGTLTKYMNQRNDAERRWADLQQQVDVLKTMFDPETGKFKGLAPEEIANLKNIFFRELYKWLDMYWSTRVGKNINVFGERDTTWYDNVFRTFKNLSNVRSDKKIMNLLNQYKEVTHSEFPKDMSRRLNRIQALEGRLINIAQGYRDQGIDVNKSPEYQNLVTRLNNLKAQKDQINEIFNKMSGTVQAAIHSKLEKAVTQKITEEKPSTQTDLDKKVEEGVKETVKRLEPEMSNIVDAEQALKIMEGQVAAVENKLGIEAPADKSHRPPVSKTSYDRTHPDFNLRILYGPVMQKTIAKMLSL